MYELKLKLIDLFDIHTKLQYMFEKKNLTLICNCIEKGDYYIQMAVISDYRCLLWKFYFFADIDIVNIQNRKFYLLLRIVAVLGKSRI